jgi:hypothetical protein
MKSTELILKPKNSKTILLVLVSLIFIIGGLLIIKEEASLKGWLITFFFGLCVLVFLIQLIPGSSQLKLTDQGFIITSLFQSTFTKWSDIKSFKTGYISQNKTVMFDYVDSHKNHSTGKKIAKQLSGSQGALPITYGIKASELLRIMNEWKSKS